MKKILLPLLAITPLCGLPLNNPIQPCLISEGVFCDDPCEPAFFGLFDIGFGFYGDYIFNTHMRVGHTGTVKNVSVMTNAGEIDISFCNFDIFATVGATNITVMVTDDPIIAGGTYSGVPALNTIDGDAGTSWSVGARWALFKCGCWGAGIEGQYFSATTNLNTYIDGSIAPIYFNGPNIDYRSWQVGGGVNYTIQITECFSINPYAGAFWTDSSLNFGNVTIQNVGTNDSLNVQLFDLEKDRQYGWAFGVTLAHGSLVTLTGEGRWAGEKALFITGQIQF